MHNTHIKYSKPLKGRANGKAVSLLNRHFLVGGLSPSGAECNITELIFQKTPTYLKAEWRYLPLPGFDKVFTPRNSFAACASKNKIFIYGGLSMDSEEAKCLDDLIEIDVGKMTFRLAQQKGYRPPALNSMTLEFDYERDRLVLVGGANDAVAPQFHLYAYDLKSCEWERHTSDCYKEGVWQHTSHLVDQVFSIQSKEHENKPNNQKVIGLDLGIGQDITTEAITYQIKKVTIGEEPMEKIEEEPKETKQVEKESKGPYILLVGGCKNPYYPYPYITHLDMDFNVVKQQFLALTVAHESNIYEGKLFVMGGSDGTIPLNYLMTVYKGYARQEKGLYTLGAVSFRTEHGLLFYGGINPESGSFNGFALVK